jgi:hypothetical protein
MPLKSKTLLSWLSGGRGPEQESIQPCSTPSSRDRQGSAETLSGITPMRHVTHRQRQCRRRMGGRTSAIFAISRLRRAAIRFCDSPLDQPAIAEFRRAADAWNESASRRRRGQWSFSVRPAKEPKVATLWSRLGSNQRPPACEAGALPLSYETGCREANDVEE